MSESHVAGWIAVATIVAMRLVDWVLPRRHHWKAVEKYGVKETDDD